MDILAGLLSPAKSCPGCFNPRPLIGSDNCGLEPHTSCLQFQSTPPHGGRPATSSRSAPQGRFNPRPRTGGDPFAGAVCEGNNTVSIHAPARGATWEARGCVMLLRSFNPRPRTGGDTSTRTTDTFFPGFNPRPRTGGDLHDMVLKERERRFNPRPRTGGDALAVGDGGCPKLVSIHAPARGATFAWRPGQYLALRFNPRPRTGGDFDVVPLTS